MITRFKLACVLCVTSVLLSAVPNVSAVIVRPDEPVSEDTLIYEGLPGTPVHGIFPTILPALASATGIHDADSLIKFDLSSLPNDPIVSATLNLYVGDISVVGFGANPDATHPVVVHVHANLGPFFELGTSWNTAPAFGGIVDSLSIDAINQQVSFDVSSLVPGWLASPASNFGMRLTTDGTVVLNDGVATGVVFHSASINRKPYLRITYVPEPATAALALCGGMLLLNRRRCNNNVS